MTDGPDDGAAEREGAVPTDYDGTAYPQAESASDLAGVPDGLSRLWTPHRIAYIEAGGVPSSHECPFCVAPTLSDEQGLIVHRGEHAFVLMNLFPYNSGHLLICPYRHVAGYDETTEAESAEMTHLTQTAMRVLRATSGPAGFNIGMNQGAVAGAGVAAHLHQHVVPRWASDANFFPIIAQTKAIPKLLGDARRELAEAWPV
ncbi:HIT domain-containing protein [Schumannella luteola]|uniref:ATP adenylyltransferase n=1 Tax=Schumannella luteola TaxID=472059 RepID=A0A852YFM5_9MICO|nr:ATP adenylyltransferase [Schumannella luteola]